jgi:hypothetical protein
MSPVISEWITQLNEYLPERYSAEWNRLVNEAVGTTPEKDEQRMVILENHMWANSLPAMQPIADENNITDHWKRFIANRQPVKPVTVQGMVNAAGYAAELTGSWEKIGPEQLLKELISV